MYSRIFAVSSLLALGISLPLAAQKTPWGDFDLQGTWTSDDTLGVPMERPVTYGDRLYLTEDELKEVKKAFQIFDQDNSGTITTQILAVIYHSNSTTS